MKQRSSAFHVCSSLTKVHDTHGPTRNSGRLMPPYPYWGSNPHPEVGDSVCYHLCYEDDNIKPKYITFG